MKNLKLINTIYIFIILIIFLLTSCSSVKDKQIDKESGIPEIVSEALPAVNNETDSNEAIGGLDDLCIHYVVSNHIPGGFEYDGSYHSISGDLINQIDNDKYNEWRKITNDDLESFNIVGFVEYFNFDKLLFQTIVNTRASTYYWTDYNIDVIYSGDAALIEKYYTSGMERIGDILKRNYLLFFKDQLFAYLLNERSDEFNEWVKKKNSNDDWKYCELSELIPVNFDGNIRQWSIAEVVTAFNIPKDDVEKAKNLAEKSVSAAFTFDIELLYDENKRAEIENELLGSTEFSSIDPVLYDNKFIDFDNNKQAAIWDNIAKEYLPIG